MKKMMKKVYPFVFAAMMLFPAEIFAHGTEEEHQREGILGNYIFIGLAMLFVVFLLSFLLTNKKMKQLNNAKKTRRP